MRPSLCSVTVISDACPFIASSTELSTISQIKWCSPAMPTPPMYMPGRLRTGSKSFQGDDVFGVVTFRCGAHGSWAELSQVGNIRGGGWSRSTGDKPACDYEPFSNVGGASGGGVMIAEILPFF